MKDLLVNELLKRNNQMLKILHDGFGFDYNKDFSIIKIEGNFTHNSILKAIDTPINDYNVALIVTGVKYQEKQNYLFSVHSSGFGLEPPYKIRYDFSGYWTCYAKSQLESYRKEKNIISYIIMQNQKLISNNHYKYNFDYNTNTRYKYMRHIGLSSYVNPKAHGVSQIDLKDFLTGRQFTYKCRSGFDSDETYYFVDKSGYIVEPKRQELKEKARQLKIKRKKQQVDSLDFSDSIKELRKDFEIIKNNVSSLLFNSHDYDSMKNIYEFIRKLQWILLDIERIEETNNNKNFSSLESANYKINYTKEELNSLKKSIVLS